MTTTTPTRIISDHEPDRAAHRADTDAGNGGPMPGFAFVHPGEKPRKVSYQKAKKIGSYCGTISNTIPRTADRSYDEARAEALAIGQAHVDSMEPATFTVTVKRVQTVEVEVEAFSYQEADYYGLRADIPEDAWSTEERRAGFFTYTPATDQGESTHIAVGLTAVRA